MQAAAASKGWRLERENVANCADFRRSRLLADLGVGTVLDVGANVGRYGREIRAYGYTGRIVSFEPLSRTQSQLRASANADPKWEVRQLALSEFDGEAEFNISSTDVWSSMLARDGRTRTDKVDYVGTETVRTARLDSLDVLDGNPAWVKLDVQGFEMQVVAGAERTLEQVTGVECEMSVEPFYEGQPSPRQMIDRLDDLGFRLTTVNNGFVRHSGRAMWIDGLFVRA